jgi:putative transposase
MLPVMGQMLTQNRAACGTRGLRDRANWVLGGLWFAKPNQMLPRAVRRLPGCTYVGARLYFVTVLTKSRRRFFVDSEVVACCDAEIRRAATKTRFEIIAACYMPDHLHLLVEGRSTGADFRQFRRLAKQLSAYYVKRRLGLRLWRRGYYDRVVRQDEDPLRYVRYIRANPVRAGLVRCADDYPFLFIAPSWRDLLGRACRNYPDGANPGKSSPD